MGGHIGHAHGDDVDPHVRQLLTYLLGEPRVVDKQETAGLCHDPSHRPEIGERSKETGDTELGDIQVRVRMIEAEFRPVVLLALVLQQIASAGMVQLAIMQHDQTWIPHEIRPHVVMTGRVAELVHDQVIWVARPFPDEIVRIENVGRTCPGPRRRGVDERVDRVGPFQPWE